MDNIQTLQIKVTERISKKNILKFIRTSIEHSDLIFDPQDSFYYKFIKDSLTYEIIIFNSNTKLYKLPFLFKFHYKNTKSNSTTDLFYTDHYFTIFKDKELLVFKKIKNTSKDDLLIYIKQVYKLNIDNSIKIDNTKLLLLKDQYHQNKTFYKPIIYKIDINNSFRNFILFTISMLIILCYLFYDKSTNTNSFINISNQQLKFKKQYEKLYTIYRSNNKKDIDKLINFFKYLKINNIKIDKISLANSSVKTILIDHDKSKLLNFLNSYKKDIKVKSIKYNNENQNYSMDITIEL
jgi:hypothetical protein